MKTKSKKGQIGTTLTWFVAFFIIVGIMIIYLVFTGFLAGKKEVFTRVPFLGEGKNEINILISSNDFSTQRELFYLLHAPLIDDTTIKNLILEWSLTEDLGIKEKINSNVRTLLENSEEKCYLFLFNNENVGVGKNLVEFGNTLVLDKKILLREEFGVAELSTFSNNQKINFKLYSTKC